MLLLLDEHGRTGRKKCDATVVTQEEQCRFSHVHHRAYIISVESFYHSLQCTDRSARGPTCECIVIYCNVIQAGDAVPMHYNLHHHAYVNVL